MDKEAILDATREDVSRYVAQPVRTVSGSPIGLAAGVGVLGAGAGMLGWRALVNTTRSLGRLPAQKLFGMSNAEWNNTMDEALDDKVSRYVVPSAAGLLAAGFILGANYNPRETGNGLTSWYPHVAIMEKSGSAVLNKIASMQKSADDLFMYSGYVPEIDFSKPVNIGVARNMFDNNPYIKDDPYVRNLGKSILNSASINAGVMNPTLGQINDSAVEKFKNKFTLGGIVDIGTKTALANVASKLFVDVVDTFASLEPSTQEKIVDTATLGTALISILK